MRLLTHAPRSRSLRPSARAVRHSSTASTSDALNSDTVLLRLPDRQIAYSIFTPARPVATLFFLHGYPSSRLEAAGLAPLALERGLRLVSPDRPGFGQSSFHPYTINNYTRDVLAVADAVGAENFSVLGASGGGPFALALARERRVDKIGLLATAPPWDGPVNDSSSVRRVAALLAQTPLFAPLAAASLASARWAVTRPWAQRRIDAWIASMSPDTVLDSESATAQRDAVLRTLLEPFAHGVQGLTHETRLLTQPWGIDYEEVEREVRFWHAAGDKAAPISMVRPMVGRLPCAQLTAFEGGHGDVATILPEVLDYFLPQSAQSGDAGKV